MRDPLEASTAGGDERRHIRVLEPTLRFIFRGARGIVDEAAIRVPPGATRLGRVRAADAITLEDDSQVSREHARLHRPESGPVVIEDTESRHGVQVNGERVTRRALEDGDVVRLGTSFLVIRYEDPHQRDVAIPALAGRAPAIQELRVATARVAREAASVLVLGETGTGKELVARAVHELSGRKGRFVAINCSAISPTLAESELFGHVAGAFTGSIDAHQGVFVAAQDGTLFLDEIGDMPPALQPKLLRALEQKEVTPVGSTRPVALDVRVVAATATRLAEDTFRGDLYARLAQLRITTPPLRDRREDILSLLSSQLPAGQPLAPSLVEVLLCARWDHNVRELFAVATELRVWGKDAERLEVEHLRGRLPLPEVPSEPPPGPAPPEPTAEALAALVAEHGGNVAAIAKLVGRSRTQVYRWLEKHGIDLDIYRR